MKLAAQSVLITYTSRIKGSRGDDGMSVPDASAKTPRRRRSSLARLQEAIFLRSESVHSLGGDTCKSCCDREIKEIEHDDLEVGELLGTGGFSHIYEVKKVRRESLLDCLESEADDPYELGDCQGAKFVVKYLRPNLRNNRSRFCEAAADLALEAKLLSSLDHPSIIRLHGVTQGCAASAFLSEENTWGGYFLLLEKLEHTLDERIRQWREESKIAQRGGGRLARIRDLVRAKKFDRHKGADDEFFVRRLIVAQQIAGGMEYLHGRNILYRDLKPTNVGFTSSGVAKLFDFGLATVIDDKSPRLPNAACGTPIYMAPEAARNSEYGLAADVYSFAILLWEICALDRPFRKYTRQELRDKVVYGTVRPRVEKLKRSPEIRDLVVRCWSGDPLDRPNFSKVSNVLREELALRNKQLGMY